MMICYIFRCSPPGEEVARVGGGGDSHHRFGGVVVGVPAATGEATTILTTEQLDMRMAIF
jgi:hypothetical protein